MQKDEQTFHQASTILYRFLPPIHRPTLFHPSYGMAFVGSSKRLKMDQLVILSFGTFNQNIRGLLNLRKGLSSVKKVGNRIHFVYAAEE